MTRFILVAVASLALCIPSIGQRSVGTISGTIFDPDGNPIQGATASAFNDDGVSGIVPKGVTDRAGHFVIRSLPFGTYAVYPGKPEAGYPELDKMFYTGFDTPLVEVRISADVPSPIVALHLGKKGGWLTGSVRDDSSGKLVESCSALRWKSNPQIGFGGLSGIFRMLVPSDTPLTIKVWSWGFEPWVYRGADAKDYLSVAPGQKLGVEIRLKRSEPEREPMDQELVQMKKSVEETGCSTPEPADR